MRSILPGRTDAWLAVHAGREYHDRLLRAGVKVCERLGMIVHFGTAPIDGVRVTDGLIQLGWRGFLHNRALNAVRPDALQLHAGELPARIRECWP